MIVLNLITRSCHQRRDRQDDNFFQEAKNAGEDNFQLVELSYRKKNDTAVLTMVELVDSKSVVFWYVTFLYHV